MLSPQTSKNLKPIYFGDITQDFFRRFPFTQFRKLNELFKVFKGNLVER